jgi:radical SAM-linked protein
LEERRRWLIEYTIGGDLKFISHHDMLRLFRRALARADVPVRFSEGFNPHPRMSIPLPRALGIASNAEAIVIETEEEVDESTWLSRLQSQMPEGIVLCSARRLAEGERPQPDIVTYRYMPQGAMDSLESGVSTDDLDKRIERLISSESLWVERIDRKTKRTHRVDLRPYLIELRRDGDAIRFTLRVTGGGTARPAEIVGLLGFDSTHVNHRIHRESVRWR